MEEKQEKENTEKDDFTQFPLVEKGQNFVYSLLKDKLDKKFIYHNYKHANEVAEVCREMAEHYELSEEDRINLYLAAFFHDTGYIEGAEGHEERSITYFKKFAEEQSIEKENIDSVNALIKSTERTQTPKGLLEEILHDADVINVGKKAFFYKGELLRYEWNVINKEEIDTVDWEKEQLEFLLKHKFYTSYAIVNFSEQRGKNIEKQRSLIEKAQKTAVKLNQPVKGVETMFRSVYRNHINLSDIADNKANMMISTNAVIVSVIIAVFGSNFTFASEAGMEHLRFTVPMFIWLVGSLFSVVFAVLSASPNVTKKNINLKKIEENKSSLLFFGNFKNLELKDFIEKMKHLMENGSMVYDNMSVDLYYLGLVLDKKYKMLTWSYRSFLVGFVSTIVGFLAIYLYSIKS